MVKIFASHRQTQLPASTRKTVSHTIYIYLRIVRTVRTFLTYTSLFTLFRGFDSPAGKFFCFLVRVVFFVCFFFCLFVFFFFFNLFFFVFVNFLFLFCLFRNCFSWFSGFLDFLSQESQTQTSQKSQSHWQAGLWSLSHSQVESQPVTYVRFYDKYQVLSTEIQL